MKHKIGLLIEDMILYERESQRRINQYTALHWRLRKMKTSMQKRFKSLKQQPFFTISVLRKVSTNIIVQRVPFKKSKARQSPGKS